MEYKINNKYYKLGVLVMNIPIRKNFNQKYCISTVFGKCGGSLSPKIAFQNLEKLFLSNEELLKETKKLKEEFTEEELKLFIKFSTNIGNPQHHVSKEDEEMFLRGILARK